MRGWPEELKPRGQRDNRAKRVKAFLPRPSIKVEYIVGDDAHTHTQRPPPPPAAASISLYVCVCVCVCIYLVVLYRVRVL